MRNKLFLSVLAVFLFAIFFFCPAKYLLSQAGLVHNTNVGNVIEVEKVYPEDAFGASAFNAVERFKRDINDIYINYLPFYIPVTSAIGRLQQNMNQPVTSLWLQLGTRTENSLSDHSDDLPVQPIEEAQQTDPAEDNIVSEIPEPAEEEPEQPAPEETLPHTDLLIEHAEAIYRTGNEKHRYYQIQASDPETGSSVDFYIRVPAKSEESLRPAMEAQLHKFNRLADTDGIDLFIYAATTFEDTVLCDQLLPSETKSNLFRDFQSGLSDKIHFGSLHLDTLEEKQEKYWATDHHWNYIGYAEAYHDISVMLQEKYPDWEELVPEYHVYPDVQFFGTNAVKLGRYDLWDTFGVAVYPLPEHSTVRERGVNYGGWTPIPKMLDTYDSGSQINQRGYGHYIEFFQILKEVHYPDNHFGRNLLLVCDSYSPPLMEAIAAGFDDTWIRYVDNNVALQRIFIDSYVQDLGITDVLVLQGSNRIIYDYYGDSLRRITIPD